MKTMVCTSSQQNAPRRYVKMVTKNGLFLLWTALQIKPKPIWQNYPSMYLLKENMERSFAAVVGGTICLVIPFISRKIYGMQRWPNLSMITNKKMQKKKFFTFVAKFHCEESLEQFCTTATFEWQNQNRCHYFTAYV